MDQRQRNSLARARFSPRSSCIWRLRGGQSAAIVRHGSRAAIAVFCVDHRNSALSHALRQVFYFTIGNLAWVTNVVSDIYKGRRPVRMRNYLNQTCAQLAQSARSLLFRRHACWFPFIVILLGLPSVMPGADINHHVFAAGLKRLIPTTAESWHAVSPPLTPTTVAPYRKPAGVFSMCSTATPRNTLNTMSLKTKFGLPVHGSDCIYQLIIGTRPWYVQYDLIRDLLDRNITYISTMTNSYQALSAETLRCWVGAWDQHH